MKRTTAYDNTHSTHGYVHDILETDVTGMEPANYPDIGHIDEYEQLPELTDALLNEFVPERTGFPVAPPESKRQSESDDTSGDNCKRLRKEPKFKTGQHYEAENNDELLYRGTISEVEYIGEHETKAGHHLCKMLAFDADNVYEWKEEELHSMRNNHDNVNEQYILGEKVHVRLRNRTGVYTNGRPSKPSELDGQHAKRGVWVKATVTEIKDDGSFRVEHVKWNARTKNRAVTTTVVRIDDVRKAYA
jgi:hypothetical protein